MRNAGKITSWVGVGVLVVLWLVSFMSLSPQALRDDEMEKGDPYPELIVERDGQSGKTQGEVVQSDSEQSEPVQPAAAGRLSGKSQEQPLSDSWGSEVEPLLPPGASLNIEDYVYLVEAIPSVVARYEASDSAFERIEVGIFKLAPEQSREVRLGGARASRSDKGELFAQYALPLRDSPSGTEFVAKYFGYYATGEKEFVGSAVVRVP